MDCRMEAAESEGWIQGDNWHESFISLFEEGLDSWDAAEEGTSDGEVQMGADRRP